MTQNIYDNGITSLGDPIYDRALTHITENNTKMRYGIGRRYIEKMRFKSTVAQFRTAAHRRRSG